MGPINVFSSHRGLTVQIQRDFLFFTIRPMSHSLQDSNSLSRTAPLLFTLDWEERSFLHLPLRWLTALITAPAVTTNVRHPFMWHFCFPPHVLNLKTHPCSSQFLHSLQDNTQKYGYLYIYKYRPSILQLTTFARQYTTSLLMLTVFTVNPNKLTLLKKCEASDCT